MTSGKRKHTTTISSTGHPCATRGEAREYFTKLTTGLGFHSVQGDGPMFMSDLPQNILADKSLPVKMGIDEAGRGSVIGPMTYGAAFWQIASDEICEKKGFDDSKALDHAKRKKLFKLMEDTPEVGYVVRCLHASEISRKMLRPSAYNLNEMSHDTAIDMIRAVLNAGVNVTELYIDTVGTPEFYLNKLNRAFDGKNIKFTVCKKADSLFKTCSAASIAAKVARDEIVENFKFSESNFAPINGIQFGSGYPSDPKCKEWLDKNLADPFFGFPDAVRFSWAPIKQVLDEKAAKIKFEADERKDEAAEDVAQTSMASFVTSTSNENKAKKAKLGGLAVHGGFQILAASDFL